MKRTDLKIAVALSVMAIFLFSGCTNDPDDIKKIAVEEELKPLNVQRNILYDYSDSATTRLILKAPVVKDYSHAEENPYYEFAEGIDVTFFDKFGKEERHLRANYAKQLTKEVETIAHSVGVTEPRQIRRSHVRIVQPDGRTRSMAELFPRG